MIDLLYKKEGDRHSIALFPILYCRRKLPTFKSQEHLGNSYGLLACYFISTLLLLAKYLTTAPETIRAVVVLLRFAFCISQRFVMAHIVHQHSSAKSVYDVGIEFLEERKRRVVREEAEQKYGSSLLGNLLSDLVVSRHDDKGRSAVEKGEIGENDVLRALAKGLSNDWWLFSPYIIFPRPTEYAQLDHLVLGPPGIFIVETKAWRGSFMGKRDAWSRRVGNSWESCDSPTHQLMRHVYWLRKELARHQDKTLPSEVGSLVEGGVVFTEAKWVKAFHCGFKVYDSIPDLLKTFRDDSRQRLTRDQLSALCGILAAPPNVLHQQVRAETPPPPPVTPNIPHCPLCHVPMVKRTAKKGANAGNAFWGCPRYPDCRQILPATS